MAKKENNQDNPFMDMFNYFGRTMPMPTMDVEKLMDHHRKNLEALQQSAQNFSTGASSVMQKQREILEDGLKEIRGIAESYQSPSGVSDAMSKQADFARASFEKALKDAGELAEIVKDSGGDTVDLWRSRVEEIVTEVREAFEKQSGGKG